MHNVGGDIPEESGDKDLRIGMGNISIVNG